MLIIETQCLQPKCEIQPADCPKRKVFQHFFGSKISLISIF